MSDNLQMTQEGRKYMAAQKAKQENKRGFKDCSTCATDCDWPDGYNCQRYTKKPIEHRDMVQEELIASQAREAELQEKLEKFEYLLGTFSDVLYGGESAWANIELKEFGNQVRNAITDRLRYKQRAEAAEARIKASQEQEPRAFAVCGEAGNILNVATSRAAYGRDDDLSELQLHVISLYVQPPIPPELAELQRENAELRKLLESEDAAKKILELEQRVKVLTDELVRVKSICLRELGIGIVDENVLSATPQQTAAQIERGHVEWMMKLPSYGCFMWDVQGVWVQTSILDKGMTGVVELVAIPPLPKESDSPETDLDEALRRQ